MVKQLEEHSKQLKEDAAELMEACEETEFENRRLSQQAKVYLLGVFLAALDSQCP